MKENLPMFADFANVWSIVGLTADLRPDRLLPLKLAGERVVLFRGEHGEACALIDRCPHRGVALSLGKLCDGIVQCPFHGWRFDGQGNNRHVPWNPDAKRDLLGAIALPVREAGGLIWLYTGFALDSEPLPSDSLGRHGVVLSGMSVLWKTHWTRAMENMLDSPHLPFVHRATIGKGLRQFADRRMDMAWSEQPYGARIENRVDGRDSITRLDYRFPNAMELFIDPTDKLFRMLAICQPEDDEHTRMRIIILRDFARSALLNPFFRYSNRRIAREDQAILESTKSGEVPPAATEKSVRTDIPTLAFRKIYFDRLKGSSASNADA